MGDILEHHNRTIGLAISDYESSVDDKTTANALAENQTIKHLKPRPPSMYSKFRSINGPAAHGSDPRGNPPFVSCVDFLQELIN